jgi:hypothetical protein
MTAQRINAIQTKLAADAATADGQPQRLQIELTLFQPRLHDDIIDVDVTGSDQLVDIQGKFGIDLLQRREVDDNGLIVLR